MIVLLSCFMGLYSSMVMVRPAVVVAGQLVRDCFGVTLPLLVVDDLLLVRRSSAGSPA
jgi:hypothetical protein